MEESEIVKFFQDQTIFITGGTGFLGKVLIEKLFRQCEPEKIYILVRPKKGKTIEQRFDDFFNYPCFDRLDKDLVRNRVCFINGDCEKPNLGLNEEVQEQLIKETSIVVHAAANVKFDQPMREAANINIRSTRDILMLSKKMSQLKALIYISTAFSNCPQSHIEEKFYKVPMNTKQLLNIVDSMDDDLLIKTTPILLGKWPNTYTFTKAIAEDLIRTEGTNLPIAIMRPAIVISTISEPARGWIDNFYGVIGVVAGAALGVLRSLHAKLDNYALIVPCDYVSNAVLASACNVDKSNILIYNYVGSKGNMITWKYFMDCIENCAWDFPSEKMIWYYNFKVRENFIWHKICIFFMHTVVAHIVDFVLICVGKKPLAVENYDRINKLLSLTSYFSTNTWTFDNDNVENLFMKMNPVDQKLFNFDMSDIVWQDYARDSVAGGRIYLLKDPLETLPQGRKKLKKVQIAHYTILTMLFILLLFILRKVLNLIFQ